jgi:uncharacterized membrane protein
VERVESAVEHLAWILVTAIEAVAIAIVAIGAVQAIVRLPFAMFGRRGEAAARAPWLDFARWLIAALTFQLAADIVHTTVTPTWAEIGRVAAIAAIRTVLTLALERDIKEARESESIEGGPVPATSRT